MGHGPPPPDQQLAGLVDPLRRARDRQVTDPGQPMSRAAAAALHRAAARLGTDLGPQPATPTGPGGDPGQALTALRQTLAAPGDDPDGTIRLRNCPVDRIATHHRDLICAANHAMLQARTSHLDRNPPSTPTSTPTPDAAASC